MSEAAFKRFWADYFAVNKAANIRPMFQQHLDLLAVPTLCRPAKP